MTRILIVDDEPHLLRALVLNLRARGYNVTTATTGKDAIEQVTDLPPDIVVLDLGLPDRDGLAVIGELRSREPRLPVIVLSARTSGQDKVAALDLGAVDYVTKPFDMNELIARLRALHRRAGTTADATTIAVGEHDRPLEAHRPGRERRRAAPEPDGVGNSRRAASTPGPAHQHPKPAHGHQQEP